MNYFNRDFLIKKLLYQSRNRGCKETGVILGKFAEQFLSNMNDKDLQDFALILDNNDIDIYDWVTKKIAPPDYLDSKVMIKLLNFRI
ncbi:MAG: succinate dehydrogenase assembly factor 2 [Rickettsia endosymbiont of Bryobia graminum]|nr:succinate dehydrogenase assembly factor 2 [Rickettsia endosymbiont of Bryobia graminum]